MAEHKAIHAAFVKEFGELKAALEKNGTTPTLAVALDRKLGDWLVKHILETDRAFGVFLATKKAA